MTEPDLDDVDRAALEECLRLVRSSSDPKRREQIEDKLQDKTQTWFRVADFACYGCQRRAMKLQLWEDPPSSIGEDEDEDVHNQVGRKVLQQLLAAGLSRYEPDPMAALAKTKRKTKRK
jgi:hypothetical protein